MEAIQKIQKLVSCVVDTIDFGNCEEFPMHMKQKASEDEDIVIIVRPQPRKQRKKAVATKMTTEADRLLLTTDTLITAHTCATVVHQWQVRSFILYKMEVASYRLSVSCTQSAFDHILNGW